MTLLIVSLRGAQRRSNPDPTMQPDRNLRPLALDQSGDTLGDIIEGGILTRPFVARYRLAIRRQRLQLREVTTLPQAGAENDRDHKRRPCLMSAMARSSSTPPT
jgi:hypothetical protein